MKCLFCEIIKGEIPCYKIYEDKKTLAFLDISKEGYGHTLVVPKNHVDNIVCSNLDTLKSCMKAAKKIINHYIKNCGFSGANIIINNGESAGQSINHLHLHIIPRKDDDGIGVWKIPQNHEDLVKVQKKLEVKE